MLMLYGAVKRKERKVPKEEFFLTFLILFSVTDWLWQINAAVTMQTCSRSWLSVTFVLELII